MPVLEETGDIASDRAGTGGADLGPRELSFRDLRRPDVALIHRWLNAPHVARWWRSGGTLYRAVEEEYLPYIEGREPVRPYLILHGDRPIGYIQAYPISHDEEYARLVDVENSVGVDLFIGEEFLHRGLGSRLLRRFLAEEVFPDPGVEVCVIGPEPENAAAVRTYERAGFRFFKTIQIPEEPEPEYLMRMTRTEFEESGGAGG